MVCERPQSPTTFLDTFSAQGQNSTKRGTKKTLAKKAEIIDHLGVFYEFKVYASLVRKIQRVAKWV